MQIGDDILDLRTLRDRMDDLQTELDDTKEEEGEEFDVGFWSEEIEELKTLKELFDEVGDPDDEPTLILESYFEKYAMDFAEEIGVASDDDSWPLSCIDWKYAARQLQHDYSAVEIDSYTYWQRA